MKLKSYSTLQPFAIPFVEIITKAMSFVNILLLIRIVNIYDYANYSYTLSIVLWSAILMDGGINNLIYNKCLQKDKEGINKLYTARFFLSIAVMVIIWLFFYLFKTPLFQTAVLLCLIVYFTSTSSLIKMLSRGLGYFKVDVISIFSEPFLKFIILLLIYFTKDYFDFNLNTILLFYLAVGIIAFFLNKYFLSPFFKLTILFDRLKLALSLIKESLKKSKYYLLYFLMFIGIVRIDVVFIEYFSTKTDVAVFSSAFSIYQVAQLFFYSIITSQFLKLHKNQTLFLKYILPGIFLAIIVTFFLSPYIYQYLFPDAYSEGEHVLKYLIFALMPSIVSFYLITKNNFLNKTNSNFHILLVIFILKISLYFVFQSSSLIFYCLGIIIIDVIIMISLLTKSFFQHKTTLNENIAN